MASCCISKEEGQKYTLSWKNYVLLRSAYWLISYPGKKLSMQLATVRCFRNCDKHLMK
jgi:hypothetical protein